MLTHVDTEKAGLNTGDRSFDDRSQLRKALNVIPTGGAIRTTPGYYPLHEKIYRNGTSGKVAISASKLDEISANAVFVRATEQSKLTGTTSATNSGKIQVAAATFKPEHVGCLVQNTTDATSAIVTKFVSSTILDISSDIFTSGESYSLHEIGDTIASTFYENPNAAAYSDGALIGEIASAGSVSFVQVQDRLLVLSGEERGSVIHGNQFRPIGMSECFDNNSLAYTVTGAGNKTGLYKWAVTFFDESSLRESPPMLIENPDRDDGFFVMASNILEFTEATLPTNTIDTWTHYKLYCKKSEWRSFRWVQTMEKTDSPFQDNLADAILTPREPLIENRYAPAGFTRGVKWLNRAILWRRHSLAVAGDGSTAGVSVENGSDEVTLTGSTTAEWMAGSRLYMAADGGALTKGYDVKYVKDATTLVLFSDWDGDSISFGDAQFAPEPNRITICMDTYSNCEYTSPWHIYDVNPDDGDEIVSCFVIGETLYVLKKNSVWAVRYVNITDQIAEEIPTVLLDIKNISMGDGCVSPDAVTVADDGTAYWLTTDGLVNFDGRTIRQVSRSQKIDVSQYIQWQTTTDLSNTSVMFNSAWKCVEIFGLKREDGTDVSLRYFATDGKWFESDAVPSNSVTESIGMKPYEVPVEVPEKIFIPTDSYFINEGTSIYTMSVGGGASSSLSLFTRIVNDDSSGMWPISVSFDASFNPIFLMTKTSTGSMPPTLLTKSSYVQKYNATTGDAEWPTAFDFYTDALDYIKGVVQAANPGYTFSSDTGAMHPNVGNGVVVRHGSTVCVVTTFGTRWSDAPSVYRFFHTVVIGLNVENGSVLWRSNFSVNDSGTDPIDHAPLGMITTGPCCTDVDGNLWVSYDALYQSGTHGGVTYTGEDSEARIAKVSMSDGSATHYNVSTTFGKKLHIRSMSYSPYGYLLCMAYYQDTIGDINGGTIKHGAIIFNTSDMSVAVSEFEVYSSAPDDSYGGYTTGAIHMGPNTGLESTGSMCTGWEQAYLRTGVATQHRFVLVSNGTNLWQVDFDGPTITKDLVSVGVDKSDHRISKVFIDSNGDCYVVMYRNQCSSASGGDQITIGSASTFDPVVIIRKYDPQTGDMSWENVYDFGVLYGASQHSAAPISILYNYNINLYAGWTNSYQDLQRLYPFQATITGTTTSASANKLVDSGANFPPAAGSGTLNSVQNTSVGPYQSQATGLSENKLVDSGGGFDSKFIKAGAVVQNTTDVTSANVVSVDSSSQITLDADIFNNIGDWYLIQLSQLNRACDLDGRDSSTQLALDEDLFNSGDDYSISDFEIGSGASGFIAGEILVV
jgi:hypothetical protein